MFCETAICYLLFRIDIRTDADLNYVLDVPDSTYANTHPQNSKFRFHVPVDAERLRYWSKIFVMLIQYGDIVLNIVILAVQYLKGWVSKRRISAISTAKEDYFA